MLKRLSLFLAISLHTLSYAVIPEASVTTTTKAHFSLAELFSRSTYKMSASSVLQALGKFLPVNYQKGVNTSALSGCPYHIGDFAEGGVIIFLTHDGMHGLVAAIEDASPAQGLSWEIPQSYTNPKAYNNQPLPFSTPNKPYGQYYGGYKNQNIEMIQNNLSQYPAFQAAAQYTRTVNGVTYDDWFLPSSRELSLMYASEEIINQVSVANGGKTMLNVEFNGTNFPPSVYWSSREDLSNTAWYMYFFDGKQEEFYKDRTYGVRCVRAF